MKKQIMIFAFATSVVANGLAQQTVTLSTTPATPQTVPVGISRLEASGGLVTQNSFSFLPLGDPRITGNFGTTARWNSLGNLNVGTGGLTQTLNGLRTQTNGRGLVFGHSIPSGGTVSNPFIQWVGNVTGASVQPGSLDFIVADNPGSPGVPANDRFVMRLREDGKMVLGQSDIGGIYLASMDVSNNTNRVGGLFMDVKNITEAVRPVGIQLQARGNTNFGATGVSAIAFSTTTFGANGSMLTGIEGIANGVAQISMGVSGRALNTTQGVIRYGVYGEAINTSGSFAGYFAGNVFATGTITPSDEKLKTTIEQETGLDKLMLLNPVKYYYNKAAIADLKTPDVLQHGFIAQELEKVFPESVTAVNTPIFKTDSATGVVSVERIESFKGINYTSLIAVLTKSIQEQQEMLVALKNEMAALKSTQQLAKATNSGYTLSQNVPNPFSGNTIINYTLPASTERAILLVTDLNGKLQQQFNLARGSNQQTISGNSLAAGIYLYSLVVNGNEVISKKMVLTK